MLEEEESEAGLVCAIKAADVTPIMCAYQLIWWSTTAEDAPTSYSSKSSTNLHLEHPFIKPLVWYNESWA